jgi:hypothetical protein
MAFSTPVNNQITDSVTQANVEVLAATPAVAMGYLYLATAHALANAAYNATTAQQQNNAMAQAATAKSVSTLYSMEISPADEAIKAMRSNQVKGLY